MGKTNPIDHQSSKHPVSIDDGEPDYCSGYRRNVFDPQCLRSSADIQPDDPQDNQGD